MPAGTADLRARSATAESRVYRIDQIPIGVGIDPERNFGEALRLNAESVATRQKLFGVYDSPSRQPWYDALILELSVNEPWASQALR